MDGKIATARSLNRGAVIDEIEDNIRLHTTWNLNSWTVEYNKNTTDSVTEMPTSNQTKYYESDLTLSSNIPKRTGYTFQGWNTSANGTGTSYSAGGTYTANADVTLYAKWKPNSWTVEYNKNTTDSVTGIPDNQTKYYGNALTLSSNIPKRTGYTFKGWSTTSTGSVAYNAGGTYSTNAPITLYAVWKQDKPNPKTYTFDIHGYGNGSWPNAVGSNTESEHKVLATIDLTGYTKLKLNINEFHSSEGIVNIQHGNDNISKARIYIGNTLVVNATTSSTNKTTYASGDIDVSGYNGTYTIYYCYANMDGKCEAKDCTLTLEKKII